MVCIKGLCSAESYFAVQEDWFSFKVGTLEMNLGSANMLQI